MKLSDRINEAFTEYRQCLEFAGIGIEDKVLVKEVEALEKDNQKLREERDIFSKHTFSAEANIRAALEWIDGWIKAPSYNLGLNFEELRVILMGEETITDKARKLSEKEIEELAQSYRERAEEDLELCDAMRGGPVIRELKARVESLELEVKRLSKYAPNLDLAELADKEKKALEDE